MMAGKDAVDTLLGVVEIAVSAIFPPAAPVVALEKLLRGQIPKLLGDKDPKKRLAGRYLESFQAAVKDCWNTERNPLAGRWSYEDFEIKPDDLAKKYQIPAAGGRSFVYDWLCAVLDAVLKAKLADNKTCPKDKAVEFTRCLCGEWKRRFEASWDFGSPLLDKALHEFDWARYKFSLRLLPFQQIMNKEGLGGIQAIYIPPKVKTLSKEGKPEGSATFLHKLVRAKLDFTEKTKPQLVLGLPGMGKTSFSKMFVAELTEEDPECYPVFVRLRVLKAMAPSGTPWLDSLKNAPSLMDGGEPLKLTDEDMRGKRIVMILDGLDELAIGGTDPNAVTHLFTALVHRQDVPSFCAIITSRPLQMLEAREQKPMTDPHYEIQLLTGTERDALVEGLRKERVLSGTKKTFLDWVAKVDEHIEPEQHMGGQPLLLFLLADCFSSFSAAQRKALRQNPKRALVYKLIVEKTVERAYDDVKNATQYKDAGLKTPEEARQVLAEIALALHHLGREYSQRDEIHRYLDSVPADLLPPNFSRSVEALHKVLLSFYVAEHRPQDGEGPAAGAVEFIHKSIAEYLAAEAVMRRLQKACVNPRPERFAEDFFDVFGPQGIDDQMHKFLVELFQEDPSALREHLLEPLQVFVDGVLSMQWLNSTLSYKRSARHVSVQGGGPDMGDPLGFEVRAGVAALRLFSVAQEAFQYDPPCPVSLQGKTRCEFGMFLGRAMASTPIRVWSRFHEGSLVFVDLSVQIVISPAIARGPEMALIGGNLSRARLSGACLSGASLEGANLFYASLQSAKLDHANLEWANLKGANLKGANLTGANLTGASLTGANLTAAKLTRANLEEANLEGADLKGADLKGASLDGADLDGADLKCADLRWATLKWANLTGASLDGADLDRVILCFDRRKETIGNYSDTEARVLIKKHFPDAKV